MRERLYLLFIILLGILIRAGFLVTPHIDSDQAVFGLQGIHILRGEFPIFSWGYAYIGTLQSYLDALAFYLFGSDRLVLNGVTTFLSIFFILVTYLLGKEIFNNPSIHPFNSPLSKGGYKGVKGGYGGILSALFAAVAPPYLSIHGAWARHGYMETLLFGSLLLLITLRLSRTEDRKDRGRLLALLGLVSGIAFWTNFLIVVYLPACLIYILLKDRKIFGTEALLAIPSFIIGSLPFWIYNLSHSFASLGIFEAGKKQSFMKNLKGTVIIGIPEIIGADVVKETLLYGFFFFIIGIFLFSIMLVVLSGIRDLIKRESRVKSLARPALLSEAGELGEKRISGFNGIGIILLFIFSFIIIYSASNFGGSILETRRYLLPLYSAIPITISLLLLKIRDYSKPLMSVLAVFVLFINIYGNLKSYAFLDEREFRRYKEDRRAEKGLFDFMKEKVIPYAYVLDYWIGPRLTFDSKEEIVFALPDKMERYKGYSAILEASDNFAYVFKKDDLMTIKAFDGTLKAMGISHKKEDIKDFTIFHSFFYKEHKELSRNNWRAVSYRGDEEVFNAFDGDIESAWFSGEPKRDGMWFMVDLGRVQRVSGLSVLPGLVPEGNMDGYSIEVSKNKKDWQIVGQMKEGLTLWLVWNNGGPRFDLYHPRIKVAFSPVDARYIRITHHGEDEYYNWTIAELFVYTTVREEANLYSNLIDKGRRLESRGDYRAAMKKYLEVLNTYGDIEEAYYRIMSLMQDLRIPFGPYYKKAEAFEGAGLIEKAIENYEKEYRRLYPSGSYSSLLLNRLIALYGRLGDSEKVEYFRERLREDFSPSEKRSIDFGGEVEFLGYDIKLDRGLEMTYYWRGIDEIKKDWTVFVHFMDSDGKVAFQNDHPLFSDERPPSQWIRGEVYKERLKIEMPEGLRNGIYNIKIGLWDPITVKRLKAREGLFKRSDGVKIGGVRIDR